MTDETGMSLLAAVQSNTRATMEINVAFTEEVSVLTEDFFNI